MQEALRKLLIGLASQVPLVGTLYSYWEQAQENPLIAGVLGILYEALVFGFGFGKKVWGQLEPEAVKYAASAVRSGVAGFAPGYMRRYKDYSRSRTWRSRLFGRTQKQPDFEVLRQTLLEMREWLQIVMDREEGKLPALEGIRIVRETVEPGAK